MATTQSKAALVFKKRQKELATSWLAELRQAHPTGKGKIDSAELEGQVREFLGLLGEAVNNETANLSSERWAQTREFLSKISASRALQGFRSDETARFIFSLKKPLFESLRGEHGKDAQGYADDIGRLTELLDGLGLFTVSFYQKAREEIISRQQEELLELSTPVVKLWEGILALPMIGTLDSRRTQIVMESLLQRIVETGSETAIIDITGVPTVDTLVAQHLLKTVTAIRLMGADCIISGVRPQIAQTIVQLGLDLEGVTTKANLADALAVAMKRQGLVVTRTKT